MPATDPPAIEWRQLHLHVGHRPLLELDYGRADTGSIQALMGRNGAGKTSLLRACLGLITPARGELSVLGQPVRRLRGAALAALRRRIGYVPQLLPARTELPITVREVVAIGRTARAGLGQRLSRPDWDTVDAWLDRLGLTPLAQRPFSQISGGEQRKTILARAMAQEPELLLLDEPTANLDLGWRERIVETIESLFAQTRLTVVLVCHELEVLPPACRHVWLLDAGRVAASGPPETVFTPERIATLYGDSLEALHGNGRHAIVPRRTAHA